MHGYSTLTCHVSFIAIIVITMSIRPWMPSLADGLSSVIFVAKMYHLSMARVSSCQGHLLPVSPCLVVVIRHNKRVILVGVVLACSVLLFLGTQDESNKDKMNATRSQITNTNQTI